MVYEKETQVAGADVTHEFLTDYLHFQIKKEFAYPLFNGYFSKVSVRLGDGAFIPNAEGVKTMIFGDYALPESLKFDQTRKSYPVQKDLKEVAGDKAEFED